MLLDIRFLGNTNMVGPTTVFPLFTNGERGSPGDHLSDHILKLLQWQKEYLKKRYIVIWTKLGDESTKKSCRCYRKI
jgi:hypothetical protein